MTIKKIASVAVPILLAALFALSIFHLSKGCGELAKTIDQKGLKSILEDVWRGQQSKEDSK